MIGKNKADSPFSASRLTPLITAIKVRSDQVRHLVEQRGTIVIDCVHGEMHFTMHPRAQLALAKLTGLLLDGRAGLPFELDGGLADKSQPQFLRELVIRHLYRRWRKAGLDIGIDNTLVCPYSSLAMLDAVLASVARPGGVILCPEGFYKSNSEHIEKLGLTIRFFPVDLDKDGRVEVAQLRDAIQTHREQLCALLLTMPGNPLVAAYAEEELEAIGRVIVEEGVDVIIDAAFDGVAPEYTPLAATKVTIKGKEYSLYDRTVTITGLSKGHHAIGPYKIGAAITGDVEWCAAIRRQLVIPFQRETAALARIVLEETPQSFIRDNRGVMHRQQIRARALCADLTKKFGMPVFIPIGSQLYGPFLTVRLSDKIMELAGIRDGWQVADFLLAGAGLEVLAGPRMGMSEPVVRINIDAPRVGTLKDPGLLDELFMRLERLMSEVVYDGVTYQRVLARIGESTVVGVADFPRASSKVSRKITILKEDTPGEHRVALTPRFTADLIAAGMDVWVESNAGVKAGYSDEAYQRAGAVVTAERARLLQGTDVLAWVKPPHQLDAILSQLAPNTLLIGFTYPFHNTIVADAARRWHMDVQSLEMLALEELPPAVDALAAMGHFAGRIALQDALALRSKLGHKAQEVVLVIGAGQTGMAAAYLASRLGHRLIVASTGRRRERELQKLVGATYYSIEASANLGEMQQKIAQIIAAHTPTIIITTAKHENERAPLLLPAQTLARLAADTVIIDFNSTRGCNVEGSLKDQSLLTDKGVWICNRSNYPSNEPAKSSSAYAACLVKLLLNT
jgi:NAD/NADP transhydrogenase alpha subunit/aspartate/methionine/tyrosine aminotransferase